MKKLIQLFLVISFIAINLNLYATPKIWTGISSNNWNSAGNWSPSGVPASGDDVTININAAILVDVTPTINSLTISGTVAVSFTSSGAGRIITIANTGSSIGIGSTLTLQGSTGSGTRSMDIAFSGTNRTMSIAGILDLTAVGDGSVYTATNSLTTVSGTIKNDGGTITSTASNLTFSAGGTYQHNINAGTIPTATWNATSTCLITGLTGTDPTGDGQAFGNLTYDCSGMTSDRGMASSGLSIAGNFNVTNTGASKLLLNQTPLTIGGNCTINDNFRIATGNTSRVLNVSGIFTISGGTLTMSDGSATGTLNLSGNFIMSGGTITETSTGSGAIVFSKTGTQIYTKSAGTISNTINFTVSNSSILDMGTSVIDGSIGTFALSTTSGIITAHPQGLSTTAGTGSIQVTGTKTYTAGASFTYNASGAQVTGNGLPATITGAVTIANGSTTTTTNAIAVNTPGILTVNGILIPGAASQVLSGTGSLTGSGTVQVNRTTGTADFSSQYTLTTKTLTNLTVEYTVLTGVQVVSALTYGSLKLDNISGINTVGGPITVYGTFTTTGGGILNMANNALTVATVNSSGIIRTQNAITSGKTWGGTVEYYGTGQTVASGTYNNLIINQSSGTATLGGSSTVSGTLTQSSGLLNVGANILTIDGNISNVSPDATRMIVLDDGVNLGTLNVKVPNNQIYRFYVGDTRSGANFTPAIVTFSAGTSSTSYLALTMIAQKDVNNNSITDFLKRSWTFTPTNLSSPQYTIELDYVSGDVNGTESNIWFGKYSGSTWTLLDQPNTSNHKFTSSTTLTSFSTFTGGEQGLLPVELSSFSSSVNVNNVKLTWITASETNNQGFEIYRKSEQTGWMKIGFVSGSGTVNTPKTYSYNDNGLSAGKYSYELKQIDFNGNFEFFVMSGITEIGVPKKFEASQNYPNPFNPVTKIDYQLPDAGKIKLVIYDMLGREVKNLVNEVKPAGFYSAEFDATSLASGIYIYRLSFESSNNNFIITKRMSLIK